jgi:hypothetical protein
VFALTNVVLSRAEAFRHALSLEWPPRRFDDWAKAVEEARVGWTAWVENRTTSRHGWPICWPESGRMRRRPAVLSVLPPSRPGWYVMTWRWC